VLRHILNSNDEHSAGLLSCGNIEKIAIIVHDLQNEFGKKTTFAECKRTGIGERKMFLGVRYWRCATPDCENKLDDKLQRCSYRKKFCDECRKIRYMETRKKRLGSLKKENNIQKEQYN